MSRGYHKWGALVALGIAVAWAGNVQAAAPTDHVVATNAFRASKLIGLNVRNDQNEKLGSVDDLVLNVETGKIQYLALSFGGILGLGEKLFAVPMSELRLVQAEKETYFVLNVSKERLKTAPGFDKDNWPNFADPTWSEGVDKYYHSAQTDDQHRTNRQ